MRIEKFNVKDINKIFDFADEYYLPLYQWNSVMMQPMHRAVMWNLMPYSEKNIEYIKAIMEECDDGNKEM